MAQEYAPEAATRRSARFRPWLLIVILIGSWFVDSMVRRSLGDRALVQAGYVERTTRRNLLPQRCGLLDYETVFWGQGPGAAEAQGYVCISYFRAPEIHRVGRDELLEIDIHG